ncbi:MAG: ATP-binding protein [Clostridiales bacterium]|nr:ATP-binding protein [Clostridiales bacterium]
MKNIIIAGPSRSGKSTLAKMIHNEFGSYVISIDKLVAVFQNAYPQLDIRLNWNRDKTTENIAPFIGHYLGMFSSSDGRGLESYSHGAVDGNNFVLEGAYYDFDRIGSILRSYGINDDFICIGLVQCGKTAEEFFADFREHDTEKDWTYNLSDDELKEVSEEAVSYNKEMYEQLANYGFKIYNTSNDREEVFKKIINSIRKEIKDVH